MIYKFIYSLLLRLIYIAIVHGLQIHTFFVIAFNSLCILFKIICMYVLFNVINKKTIIFKFYTFMYQNASILYLHK